MTVTPFHPAVASWFRQTFHTPTEPQRAAWPAIAAGRHTLIAAPTGSGKTLAAFLAALDDLVRRGLTGGLEDETHVLYVSPLKALSNDIEKNLRQPLAGIREQLAHLKLPDVDVRVLVRTGDTTPAERAAMAKRPPHVLITTPESLYLLLTSESGRAMLSTVRTAIVDEIHAVAGTKRGAHLALSLERLAALVPHPVVRVGLSATQKPVERVARFLVGTSGDAANEPECTIVDSGHVRNRDLALELPGSPLEAVMSGETWEQVYDRLAHLIQAHRTTLVFVNTRRLAERVTRHLSERLGKEHVTSHHGSLSKESRFDAEQRLKEGRLRALVATASLELGIDIGEVDLVCQLGTPRSIGAFLQRVGRSGHAVGALPKGRLFPLSRDELIECAALLDAVRRGELDRLRIPEKPLDVLAQQIVAEVASAEWDEQALYETFRRAWPYRELGLDEYRAVVRMLADGFSTRRGRRAAYLHRDAVNRRLRGRKGARLTALMCGGAIPDNADYRVVLEPTGTPIGSVNEDFAVESMTGDVFQLGNASYRVLKIEPGIMRVEDARGAPPSIPFWLGEAPARTDELSGAVSRLREEVQNHLGHVSAESMKAAGEWLARAHHLARPAAEQIVDYLAAAKGVLGALPTQRHIVLERFFDETGGMQLVVHSPYGSRINRAWGLSLRKRFCRKFNFELQAAATEDAIILSLGETHSFALEEVARYLHSHTVREILVQALLDAPVFTTRWRWVATTALAIRRFRGGRRNPTQLQRMDAEDLVAVVFPDSIACFENLAGDREVPDHPLVNQAIGDCLHEAMDVDGLVRLLRSIEAGEVRVLARDLPHPSPLAQEILNAKPYAFLDDAPLEERRTQAVMSRRWLDPLEAGRFAQLDPEAIARVRAEAWPEATNADELHDALMLMGFATEEEGMRSGWGGFFEELVAARRATRLRLRVPHPCPLPDTGERVESERVPGGPGRPTPLPLRATTLWVAAENLPRLRAVLPDAALDPPIDVPEDCAAEQYTHEAAFVELVRARLQALGPVTAGEIARPLEGDVRAVDGALLALEQEGFALRGQYTPQTVIGPEAGSPHPHSFSREGEKEASRAAKNPPTELDIEWCERRLLARIHRYTVERLRAEIEPVAAADYLRFLFEWQGLTVEPKPEGPQALAAILEQLEGFEAAAIAWESGILSARMEAYDPDWLDALCRSGRVVWARLTPPRSASGRERGATPVRGTPIALLPRRHLRAWQTAEAEPIDTAPLSPRARMVAVHLARQGASFFEEIMSGTGLLKTEVEEGLRELVALGHAAADSYSGLRTLLLPAERRRSHPRRRRTVLYDIEDAGRWSLIHRVPGAEGRASGGAPPLSSRERSSGAGDIPDPSRPLSLTPSPARGEGGEPRRAGARTEDNIEHVARTLLRRYGVVFRRVVEREAERLPPWLELLRVYRRLEARGEIRGGRFVAGFPGEQYAAPDAVATLRAIRRKPLDGRLLSLSAADPLNLVGIIAPGARVPALAGNRVLYRDGVPIAVQVGGEARFLTELAPAAQWEAHNALIRTHASPAARV